MRLFTAVAVAALTLVAAAAAFAAPAGRSKLNGNRPAWAKSAQRTGDVGSNQQIDVAVYLKWRNAAELDSLVAAVSNPRSAEYRQYLSPAEFRARFSPTLIALADQAAGFHHGFANPALYAGYGTSAFRDVRPSNGKLAVVRNDYAISVDASRGVVTSLRSLDHDSSLGTAPGYDNVTGVGTPNGASFLAALSG
jgi:hypothetical protein